MNNVLGLAVALVLLAAVLWFLSLPPSPQWVPKSLAMYEVSKPPAKASSPDASPVHLPDLRVLAGRLGAGTVLPTPEQIAEERRVEQEQVADALRSLKSSDVDERVGGVQQLAAYPTKEAEKRVAEALAGDKSAAVRVAAALSLLSFKAPHRNSVKVLLEAVLDRDAAVRAAALDTLQGYLNGLDPESKAFRQVRKGLAGLATSGRLSRETRATLRELLADFSE